MYRGPFHLALLLAALAAMPLGAVPAGVSGKVLDETGAAVAGARLDVRDAAGILVAAAASDAAGNFAFALPGPGEYALRVLRQGFFLFSEPKQRFEPGANLLTVTLNHLQEMAESVDVTYSPPAIDLDEPAERKELDTSEILSVPYPAPQDFRNALPLFQGVVQDNAGRPHFNGGATEQTNYMLDGFNIADPVTGRLEARVNIETVRSMELNSSRFSAEYGRGSAGSLDVRTKMGDDRWRFGGTNFIPSVSTQGGWYLNKWTPRLELSGPIVRSRAWFHNGFDAFYDVDTIHGLPHGENRTRGLSANNLSRFQVNLTPANILTGSFLVNRAETRRQGLSFLDPVETTTNRTQSLYSATLKDQIYFAGGALLDIGFAETRGIVEWRPQGDRLYQITPFGNRGNYFEDLDRHTRRDQWLANVYFPTIQGAGSHRIRFGVDAELEDFHQKAVRHDYQVLRADNSVSRYVTFLGNPFQGRSNFEMAQYVQDHWTPRQGLLFETGLRMEWNEIVRRFELSPRFSAAWAPRRLGRTKFAAGYGIFHDSIALGAITQHQDQVSYATFFAPDGLPLGPPVPTGFLADESRLRVPRYGIASFSVERQLPGDFFGRASYMRRTGNHGFAFVNTMSGPLPEGGYYDLRNIRGDRYDAVELSVRKTFSQFAWTAGYTRSAVRSNTVVDYSLDNPVFAPQMPGRLPWDTPNRFLTWGWAPVPKRLLPHALDFVTRNTSVAFLVEYRTGFPFGVVNDQGLLVGRADSRRFPAYCNINLHLERKFHALRHLWAWRFGFYNITNNGNPNRVNNNIDSPTYLAYGRGQLRAFSVRLRFLGKK